MKEVAFLDGPLEGKIISVRDNIIEYHVPLLDAGAKYEFPLKRSEVLSKVIYEIVGNIAMLKKEDTYDG